MNQPKRYHIQTWGCQMNVYDSARMDEGLQAAGWQATDSAQDADLVVLNTCHIREKATQKVRSALGRLRKDNPQAQVAVTGCVAQAEGDLLSPFADYVVGPQAIQHLPAMVANPQPTAMLSDDFAAAQKFDTLAVHRDEFGVRDFLTIQEGCDKFCTFCVVPYTRGPEFSRSARAILEEAKRMVAGGVRELVLLGQNVNGWHGEAPDGSAWRFGRLLLWLEEQLPELKRLSYTTSHPKDMHEEQYHAHAISEVLIPWLHLPVQSGSDGVLKRMNRHYDAAEYMRIIDRCRTARPDIAFSSDFIVAFPGETDADHVATLKLVREVGFASAYAFIFSPRPGAPAAEYANDIAPQAAKQRLHGLQQVLGEFQQRFNSDQIGKQLSVILEKPGRKPEQWVARSPYMQAVHIGNLPGDGWAGQELNCRVTDTTTYGLVAEPLAA